MPKCGGARQDIVKKGLIAQANRIHSTNPWNAHGPVLKIAPDGCLSKEPGRDKAPSNLGAFRCNNGSYPSGHHQASGSPRVVPGGPTSMREIGDECGRGPTGPTGPGHEPPRANQGSLRRWWSRRARDRAANRHHARGRGGRRVVLADRTKACRTQGVGPGAITEVLGRQERAGDRGRV